MKSPSHGGQGSATANLPCLLHTGSRDGLMGVQGTSWSYGGARAQIWSKRRPGCFFELFGGLRRCLIGLEPPLVGLGPL